MAGGVEMVAVERTGRGGHGQQPIAMDVIPGNDVAVVGLGNEVAAQIVDIAADLSVTHHFQPVAGAVVAELLVDRSPADAGEPVLVVEGISVAVTGGELALVIVGVGDVVGGQQAVFLVLKLKSILPLSWAGVSGVVWVLWMRLPSKVKW